MKRCILMAAALFAGMTSLAAAGDFLPVETTESRELRLTGVVAERAGDGVVVSGWVRRRGGNVAFVRGHLHIASLDAEGRVLDVAEARWSGFLSTGVRSRHGARFSARLGASGAVRAICVDIASDHAGAG